MTQRYWRFASSSLLLLQRLASTIVNNKDDNGFAFRSFLESPNYMICENVNESMKITIFDMHREGSNTGNAP